MILEKKKIRIMSSLEGRKETNPPHGCIIRRKYGFPTPKEGGD